MKAKSQLAISKSSEHFFWGTLISRIMGLMRDVAMAYVFGSSASIAALMVAFRLSHLLRRVFGEGALHAAFVPIFEKMRIESEQKAARFFKDISYFLFYLIATLSVLMLSLLLYSKALIQVDSSGALILNLTIILIPTLFFICHAAFCSSLLQCKGSYFLPSISPAVFNCFWIFGVLILKNTNINQAVFYLALWILAGLIFQWCLTLPPTLLYLRENLQSNSKRSFSSIWKSFKKLGKPLSLGLIGVSATQLNNALDALIARFIDLEGPAYLWYAIRIEQVPLALFGIALAGALLPPLSRAFQTDFEKYKELLDFSLTKALGLLVPCCIALLLIGPSCVNLLYGRGHFSLMSAHQTTYCLWVYVLGLVPQGLTLLLAPAFYVQNKYSLTTRATLFAVSANIILNLLFAFVLKLGVYSIALSTSICSWLQMYYLFYHLRGNIQGRLFLVNFNIQKVRIFLVTLLSAVMTYIIALLINHPIIGKGGLFFPRNFIVQLSHFGFLTFFFIMFLFSLAKLFKVSPILNLLNYVPLKKK